MIFIFQGSMKTLPAYENGLCLPVVLPGTSF